MYVDSDVFVFAFVYLWVFFSAAAAAAKLLQSCPTLYDPIDGSPPAINNNMGYIHLSLSCCCCCCCCSGASVVSNSVRPHRRQPTRLCPPWDSPGKNTGVGCHFLLQCMKSEKWKRSRSVVSDSMRPHRQQPTRLLCPWDFPGKSTGVGCHCLLRVLKLLSKKWRTNNHVYKRTFSK